MTAKPFTAQAGLLGPVAEPRLPAPPWRIRSVAERRGEDARPRQRRPRHRKRVVRGKSICVKRLTKVEIELGKRLFPDLPVDRPQTRGDCAQGERPCPFVSCRHHLYLDVFVRTGAIKLNFPDLEVWEMVESCTLDVADRGGTTLEDAADLMNVTRERIRQIEVTALARLESTDVVAAFHGHLSEGSSGKRRLPVLR